MRMHTHTQLIQYTTQVHAHTQHEQYTTQVHARAHTHTHTHTHTNKILPLESYLTAKEALLLTASVVGHPSAV